jgi:hypothetical protein
MYELHIDTSSPKQKVLKNTYVVAKVPEHLFKRYSFMSLHSILFMLFKYNQNIYFENELGEQREA